MPKATKKYITKLARDFDRAVAAANRFERKHVEDTPENQERSLEHVERVGEYLDAIAQLPPTDLATLQLMARAVVWCNDDLCHLDGDTSDNELTRAIVIGLLPKAGRRKVAKLRQRNARKATEFALRAEIVTGKVASAA